MNYLVYTMGGVAHYLTGVKAIGRMGWFTRIVTFWGEDDTLLAVFRERDVVKIVRAEKLVTIESLVP